MLVLASPWSLQDFSAGIASGLVVAESNRFRKIGELRLSSDGHINGDCLGYLTGPDRVLKQERRDERCKGSWVHDRRILRRTPGHRVAAATSVR